MTEYQFFRNQIKTPRRDFRKYLKVLTSLLVLFVIVFILKSSKKSSQQTSIEEKQESVRVDESIDSNEIIEKEKPSKKLRELINCVDKDFSSEIIQHGDYWLLKNYVKGSVYFKCDTSITYTSHSDFTFLDNVVPLLERWQAPLSLALWSPGDFFNETVETILNLRNCHEKSSLVRGLATFHLFFESQFMPEAFQRNFEDIERDFKCQNGPRVSTFSLEDSVKSKNNLTYPINVGRNLARESAMTHFVLPGDVELFPNPGLVEDFLAMELPEEFLAEHNVFVLPIFEVEFGQMIPQDKSSLIEMFNEKTAIYFHFKVCPHCHKVPKADDWILPSDESRMEIFTTAKRQGDYFKWEPIYIGTNNEPLYDERLNWEGKKDKMTQAYTMCLLDYNFNVLSNGFLVHKPGIKTKKETLRPVQEKINEDLINEKILPEITAIYGKRDECIVH